MSGESCSNKKGASASVVLVNTEVALGELSEEDGFDGLYDGIWMCRRLYFGNGEENRIQRPSTKRKRPVEKEEHIRMLRVRVDVSE